jgi:hypothetical protein
VCESGVQQIWADASTVNHEKTRMYRGSLFVSVVSGTIEAIPFRPNCCASVVKVAGRSGFLVASLLGMTILLFGGAGGGLEGKHPLEAM